MKHIKTSIGNEVVLYASCRELPMDRHNELRKYSLRDSGIGSDMSSTDKHFQNLDILLANGKIAEAVQERINMRMSHFIAIEKINITHISFALFVHSIDGYQIIKDNQEITEEELIRICRNLEATKLIESDVEDILDDLKKKLIPNWKYYSLSRQMIQEPPTTSKGLDKKQPSFVRKFKDQANLFLLKLKLLRITRSV